MRVQEEEEEEQGEREGGRQSQGDQEKEVLASDANAMQTNR